MGSLGGLAALGAGRADVAACAHVTPGSGEPDLSHIPRYLPGRPTVVVNVFSRELGLVVWTGNPRKLEGVGDLTRRGLRFVNRQPGSGTRAFTDEALAAAGVEQAGVVGYREEVSTHWAVALRILRGEADVGVATRAVASALSLGFVPLTRERFDLVIPKESFFQPPIQALIEAIRSERFRRELERLGGYDWTQTRPRAGRGGVSGVGEARETPRRAFGWLVRPLSAGTALLVVTLSLGAPGVARSQAEPVRLLARAVSGRR